jgi:hypothetical protein
LWKGAVLEVFNLYQANTKLTKEMATEIANHIAAMVKLTSNVYVRGAHIAVSLIKGHNGHIVRERERTASLQREILQKLDANTRPCIDQKVLLSTIRNAIIEAAGQKLVNANIANTQASQIAEDIFQKINRKINLQNGTVDGQALAASAKRVTERSDHL